MQKTLSAALVGMLSCASPGVVADTFLGVYAGAQVWNTSSSGGFSDDNSAVNYNFGDTVNQSFYAALEHGVPLIPNVKVARTSYDASGVSNLQTTVTFGGVDFGVENTVNVETEVTATDVTLYYELFDNSLVGFDVGLTAKYIDGALALTDKTTLISSQESISGIVPMLYSRVEFGMPFTGLGAYAEGNFLSFDDNTISDYQLALTYSFIENLALDMTLQVGYRNATVEVNDFDGVYTDLEYDGVFAGLEVHF